MCLLFESIKVVNREFRHLDYHQARVDRSMEHNFSHAPRVDLSAIPVPPKLASGTHKCRVIYGNKIESIEFQPYRPKQVKRIKMVEADSLEYPYKYLDRAVFQEILNRVPDFDEVIIIRNGLLTDTSYTNLAFLSGSTWHTPANPLLPGTCRQRLIDSGKLLEAAITMSDLKEFTRISLINAILDLDDLSLPLSCIY